MGSNTTTVTVTNVSDGKVGTLADPILLIIGVPNTTSTVGTTQLAGSLPASVTFGSTTGTVTVGGTAYGVTGNSTSGFISGIQLTSTSGSDVYTLLGLGSQTPNSNNWSNWSAQPGSGNTLFPTLGITVNNTAGFSLYMIQLSSGSGLAKDTSLTVTFTGGLPIGSYIIAYGQTTSGATPDGTAFTNAGLETGTNGGGNPGGGSAGSEPSSVALLGLGVVGLVGFTAWSRRRRLAVA
jgi:hypothetical protein